MMVIDAAKYVAIEVSSGVHAAIAQLQVDVGSAGTLELVRTPLGSVGNGKWAARIQDIYYTVGHTGAGGVLRGLHETPDGAVADLLRHLLDPSLRVPAGYDRSAACLDIDNPWRRNLVKVVNSPSSKVPTP